MISHDHGVIYIDIPYSGGNPFKEFYIDKHKESMKLINGETGSEIGKATGKYIRDFFDYDIFSIVKNPYHRAVDMWVGAQSKFKRSNIKKQTIGEYYENLLNNWDCADGDEISKQIDYLKSSDDCYFGAPKVSFQTNHLFYFEDLIDSNLDSINSFFTANDMPQLPFYVEYSPVEKWREYYDTHSIEIINYIFDEDFEYCGYGKI